MKIVEFLCHQHKHDDFVLYQAYYSWRTGTIEAAPLSTLKFELPQA